MTMITMAQMRAGFASILSGVTGTDGSTTLTIFQKMPRSVPDEACPALILIPGEAAYDTESEGAHTIVVMRDWTLRLLAQQEGIGDEYDEETMFDTMITPIIEKLASYQRIPVTEDPDLRRDFELHLLSGDEGIGAIEHGGHIYAGTDIACTTKVEEVITPAWR